MAIPDERKHRDQLAYIESPKTVGAVDRRVQDICANEKLDDIKVLLGGSGGTLIFDDNTTATTTGGTDTLISTSVTAGKTRTFVNLLVVCNASGFFELKSAGVVIGSGRTGPSAKNVLIELNSRTAAATTAIVLEFTQIHGSSGRSVEAYLFSTES